MSGDYLGIFKNIFGEAGDFFTSYWGFFIFQSWQPWWGRWKMIFLNVYTLAVYCSEGKKKFEVGRLNQNSNNVDF